MKKENRRSHGPRNFVLPASPNDLKSRHGCSLHRITFDASVGEEVCAIYKEEPDFADQYSEVSPFNLIVHSGLVRTPHGVEVESMARFDIVKPDHVHGGFQ